MDEELGHAPVEVRSDDVRADHLSLGALRGCHASKSAMFHRCCLPELPSELPTCRLDFNGEVDVVGHVACVVEVGEFRAQSLWQWLLEWFESVQSHHPWTDGRGEVFA